MTTLPENFTVTCHAGAMHTRANSLRSVGRCTAAGVEIMELDVSFRPDGTPVIIHNASPGKRGGALLCSALNIIAPHRNCRVNLDLKAFPPLTAIDALVSECGLEGRAFYTGVEESDIEGVRSSSRIPYYLNNGINPAYSHDHAWAADFTAKAKELGALGVNANYRNMTPEIVAAFRDDSLSVSVWTVNDPHNWLRMIEMGVDNITTKRPTELMKFLTVN